MPFGKRLSPEEQQRRMQEQQDAQTSQRLLETGSLPLQAKRRLSEETVAGHPLFTSDLSAREFALIRLQGYQPLSQVMGSSIYHISRRDLYLSELHEVLVTSEGEVTSLTAAHQDAARFALRRLEEEATLLKAHGVIGVRFTERDYEWGQNMLEYTAIGTAIRLPHTPLPEHPFLSDLSGQEFWTLLQAGYYPVGVVTGYCVYYVCLSALATKQLRSNWMNLPGLRPPPITLRLATKLLRSNWMNQEMVRLSPSGLLLRTPSLPGYNSMNREIVPFTRGIRQARSNAMSQVTVMARQLKASGVVGMHIECKRKLEEEERNRLSLWVHFSVVGTAIGTKIENHVIPKPQPTLSLTDVRPEQYGETRELTIREE